MRWDNLTANPTDSERPAGPADSGHPADPVAAGHPADHAGAGLSAGPADPAGSAGPAEGGRGRAEAAALFGADAVTTRTFDTPEFRGITFHEIRARSIINRVPGASRMPFEWTVNPYRGCAHACVYFSA